MNDSPDTYLIAALKRLEQAAEVLLQKSRNVTQETEAVKTLTELVREQVRDENPRPSNRKAG